MILNLNNLNLITTIVLTGLTAGLCFNWTNAITPGIGKLTDLAYLQAFKEINRSIINPYFLVVFFGPFFSHLFNIWMHRANQNGLLWIFLMSAVIYIVGVVMVTVFKNVPLNNILENTHLFKSNQKELSELRDVFENPWSRWHLVRTVSSIISLILLVIGLTLKLK